MSQQVAHDAYVEVLDSGACRAQVSDLPGCFAVGQDVTAALTALAERIPAYYDWLRSHDEYTPLVAGLFQVEAKAVERVTGRYPNVTEAFFPSDATPVSDEDLDWLLALLEWSLDDLISLGERIAPAQRETPTPTGSPPNALLHQVAEIQARYLVMLNVPPDPHAVTLSDAPPLGQLREVRDVSLRRLRNTSDQDRQRIIEVQGERWSLRKILRCGILSARMYAESLAAAAGE